MMKRMFPGLAMVVLFCTTGFAQEAAEQDESCQSGQCQKTAAADQECSACPIMTAAMEKLPRMTFQVGDEQTCCRESASALAEKHSLPVHFVVADESYADEAAAWTALVDQTESFVNKFVTPCECEVSGSTTVAGKSCACPVTSARNAELVQQAVEGVQMTFQVGDKSCNCPMEAASLAKANEDAEKWFVVGEQKTQCELTARLNLAHARYQAAVMAINSADSGAAEDASTGAGS